MKDMIPDEFPLNAFPTDYALKDASYALVLGEYVERAAPGAKLAYDMLAGEEAFSPGAGAFCLVRCCLRRAASPTFFACIAATSPRSHAGRS